MYFNRGEKQSQYENLDPQTDPPDQCLLKEVGQLESRTCSVFCLLQLLPNPFQHPLYSGDGERPNESCLDSEGATCSVGANMAERTKYEGHQNQRHRFTPLPKHENH